MKRKSTLHGDVAATPEKATYLLQVARDELKAVKSDTNPRDRARLRQAANKAWMALSTGADSYLLKTEKRTVKNKSDVIRVYKQLGSEAAGNANIVYDNLHIDCGYEDRPTCTRDSVKVGFRLAGQALGILSRRMTRRRR